MYILRHVILKIEKKFKSLEKLKKQKKNLKLIDLLFLIIIKLKKLLIFFIFWCCFEYYWSLCIFLTLFLFYIGLYIVNYSNLIFKMSITNGELNNNNVEDVWNQQDNELDVKLSIKCNNSLKLKEKKWGNKKVRDKDCGESKWLMIKYKNNEEKTVKGKDCNYKDKMRIIGRIIEVKIEIEYYHTGTFYSPVWRRSLFLCSMLRLKRVT